MTVPPEAERSALDDRLPRTELRRRVSSGVFAVGVWGAFNLLIGFGGNIVLARMLVPRDFGIVAIGATLMAFATTLADGGLGSGLIRRPVAPRRAELRAVLGLQLAATTVLALAAAGVGTLFGSAGLVVAVMVAGLPVTAFQTPGKVVLSRALRFRLLTSVDAAGVLAYYTWAIAGVLAGMGVWALATGVVFRALAATCAMLVISRDTTFLPTLRGIRALWPVISFGIRFQGISFAGMVREQGLNAGVAGLAGVGTLGLWTLAKRLIEIPVLIIEPLHRVAFPYMSQLSAAGEDPGPSIERGMRVTATAAGVVLTGLAASAAGLVPGVFGPQWAETAVVVQWVCGSLMVAAPLAVVAVGFLYAIGEPGIVLRATILHTLTLFAVTLPLLPFAGVNAIGAGSLTGALVDAVVLGLAVRRLSSARPFALLAAPIALAVPAAFVGALATRQLGADSVAGIAGGLIAALSYLAALYVFRRASLLETAALLRLTIRAGLGRRDPSPGLPASQPG